MPPTGARLSIIASRCAFHARSVSKAATTGRGLRMPCFEALRLTASLPAGVLGPRRFASSLVCFGLMLAPLPGVPRSLPPIEDLPRVSLQPWCWSALPLYQLDSLQGVPGDEVLGAVRLDYQANGAELEQDTERSWPSPYIT